MLHRRPSRGGSSPPFRGSSDSNNDEPVRGFVRTGEPYRLKMSTTGRRRSLCFNPLTELHIKAPLSSDLLMPRGGYSG